MRISSEEATRRLSARGNLAQLAVSRVPTSSPTHNGGHLAKQEGPSFIPSDAGDAVASTESVLGDSNVQHRQRAALTKKGSHNIPEFVRDQMIELKQMGATGDQMGEAFGVSGQAANAAAAGRSGGRPPTEARRMKIDAAKLGIKDIALMKLMKSLDLITDDKLEELGAKDLGNFATSMSKVVHSLTEAEETKSPVNIVIYSPEMKNESKYKIIDVA